MLNAVFKCILKIYIFLPNQIYSMLKYPKLTIHEVDELTKQLNTEEK